MIFVCFAILFIVRLFLNSFVSMSGGGLAIDQWIRNLMPAVEGHREAWIALSYAVSAALLLNYAIILKKDFIAPRLAFILGWALVVVSVFVTPALSNDVFAYLAYGHNAALDLSRAQSLPVWPAESEYLLHLRAVNELPAHGPTPYGPVWTYLELLAYQVSAGSVFYGMVFLKTVTGLALAGTVMIVLRWLGVGAALAILFNPFLLTEMVAEGHNDAVMIFFVVLGLFWMSRYRLVTAVLALSFGILTKFLPALLSGPALGVLFRGRKPWVRGVVIGILIFGAIAVVLYLPVWNGLETFAGIRELSGGVPAVLRPLWANYFKKNPASTELVKKFAFIFFLAYLIWHSFRSKRMEDLPRSCALVLLGYLLFFPPYVWCWYMALPVVLLLVDRRGPEMRLAFFLTTIAILNGPIWSFMRRGWLSQEDGRLAHHLTSPLILILGFLVYLAYGPWVRSRR